MKPTTIDVDAISTLTTNAQVMGIDEEGMATVLSILSNMYSDGSLAVVREYSCNALDSQQAAGNTDPILVTSPTALNPIFTVQDFGLGLSHDEMLNVYAKYGASTKRDTNDQIGSFGIGAKSAFTIGTQFTVTAVKDGMQTVALFSLNDEGAPTVNILANTETIEPNGVKVEIGVRDVSGITNAIERLFQVWKPGTVLVDGVQPSNIWDEMDSVSEDIHLACFETLYNTDSWIIVMGGIPYPVPIEIINKLELRNKVIARDIGQSRTKVYLTVPIGAVDITPSREELRDTAKTVSAVNASVEEFHTLLGPYISRRLNSADSLIAAMTELAKINSMLGRLASKMISEAVWNGKKIPTQGVQFQEMEWFRLRRKRGSYYGEKVAGREKGMVFTYSTPFDKTLFVTGVPKRRVRSVQLAAKPYMADQDSKSGVNRVIALTEPESYYTKEWFSLSDPALMTVDFDSFVKQWKPVRKASGTTRAVEYIVDSSGTTMTLPELRAEKEVYYTTGIHVFGRGIILDEVTGTAPIIRLKPTQTVEALLKRIPDAINARDAVWEFAKKMLDSLTEDDANAIVAATFLNSYDHRTMQFFLNRRTEITNPFVLAAIEQYELASSLRDNRTHRYDQIQEAIRMCGEPDDVKEKATLDAYAWAAMESTLPLLKYCFRTYLTRDKIENDHIILYVNAVQEGE